MKDDMLDYLISLLDDSNDFSWQAAKASHAVLLCRIDFIYLFTWGFTLLSTLYRSYHDG